jgi:hypothetical protein
MNSLVKRRAWELAGMLAVGDGLIATLAPTRHVELWRGGPRVWDRTLEAFAKRPVLTRGFGIAEVAFGVWLMLHQLERQAARH